MTSLLSRPASTVATRGSAARGPAVPPGDPGLVPVAPAEPEPVVRAVSAAEAETWRDAWLDLVGRSVEPNVFIDPDFALPAARHLPSRRAPRFVMVWRSAGGPLIGLCPVVPAKVPWGFASAWFHELSTLGFPLLDRQDGAEALRALLRWARCAEPRASGLVIRSLPAEGPTAAVLAAAAEHLRLEVVTLDAWSRAVLRHPSDPGRAGLDAVSAKGAKELRRQRRRLADGGPLATAGAPADGALDEALETFLALEAAGWKGAAGTALLLAPGRADFARAAVTGLARRGLCRVENLAVAGSAVAMALVLRAGDAEFLWKIAHREDLARFSPGVQLVLELTEARRRDGSVSLVDSCAVPNHPMIDRLWRDRMALRDVVVALQPGRSAGFRLALVMDRGSRSLKIAAKRVLNRLRPAG